MKHVLPVELPWIETQQLSKVTFIAKHGKWGTLNESMYFL